MDAARRALGVRQIGHTGTLDPFATGLLVLVVGPATRLARLVVGSPKEYLAVAVLGQRTDTDDLTGAPIGPRFQGPWPPVDAVAAALASMVGTQAQCPPAYSAKKVAGRRSHALARAGAAVAHPPVEVTVSSLELLHWEPPRLTFQSSVGAGTYIRVLARDLGDRLGTGGHLEALRRTRVGPFGIEEAIPLALVGPRSALISPRAMVERLGVPVVELDSRADEAVKHGRAVGADVPGGATAALVVGERLVAVAEGRQGRWQPVVVLEGR